MNEDSLRDHYDYLFTHDDPNSPYYDGPMVGEDCCEHGVDYEDECAECLLEQEEVE